MRRETGTREEEEQESKYPTTPLRLSGKKMKGIALAHALASGAKTPLSSLGPCQTGYHIA